MKYFKITNFNLWLHLYQERYISQLLKIPTILKSVNIKKIVPNEFLTYIMYTLKNIRWKKYHVLNGRTVIELLFLTMYIRNTNLFMKWLKNYFEKVDLKKHKKLFLFIKLILYYFIWNYSFQLGLRGIKLSIKGKFAKKGSVRKTRQYIIKGNCSRTSKHLSMYSKKIIIRTLTGVLGVKLDIFYF